MQVVTLQQTAVAVAVVQQRLAQTALQLLAAQGALATMSTLTQMQGHYLRAAAAALAEASRAAQAVHQLVVQVVLALAQVVMRPQIPHQVAAVLEAQAQLAATVARALFTLGLRFKHGKLCASIKHHCRASNRYR
jgi:hypothetical protein